MTSFIAAGGSGRSTSFIPAVPAAWSVTTIAFIVHLPVCDRSSSSEFLCRRDENRKAKLDGLMISGVPGRADTHSGIQSWPAPRIRRQACANLAKDGKELGWVAASGAHLRHAWR